MVFRKRGISKCFSDIECDRSNSDPDAMNEDGVFAWKKTNRET